MQRDDLIRLRHMLDAAREAVSFVYGKTRSSLDIDRKLELALVRCIETVGEAAANVALKRFRTKFIYKLMGVPSDLLFSSILRFLITRGSGSLCRGGLEQW